MVNFNITSPPSVTAVGSATPAEHIQSVIPWDATSGYACVTVNTNDNKILKFDVSAAKVITFPGTQPTIYTNIANPLTNRYCNLMKDPNNANTLLISNHNVKLKKVVIGNPAVLDVGTL